MNEIKIKRTGNLFSYAASQYLVTFPNGDMTTIWSPPWHEMERDEEDAGALNFAKELWESKSYELLNGDKLAQVLEDMKVSQALETMIELTPAPTDTE